MNRMCHLHYRCCVFAWLRFCIRMFDTGATMTVSIGTTAVVRNGAQVIDYAAILLYTSVSGQFETQM